MFQAGGSRRMTNETNLIGRITTVLVLGLLLAPAPTIGQAAPAVSVVTILPDHRLARFDPVRDWGAALDGHDLSETSTTFTPKNIAAMESAGFHPITYRLRTELGIETWHWNPAGHWSDAAHSQGYWVSNATSVAPIEMSFGYRLPRRGRTIDDANNDSFSRIDDGDTLSYWKTNPYLDPHFSHDTEAEHPQWFTVDLGRVAPVREIRLLWGAPYPRRYNVEYWDGDQTQLIDDNPSGEWRRFENGTITLGVGGDAMLQLSHTPVETRFLRVVMYESSHTASGGNGDLRDSLGFALREIYAGDRDSSGAFRDIINHDTLPAKQSVMLVSSTDPWHRAIDRDSNTAQPGFDLIFRTGLTRGMPMLVPTGLLYDTPENAAAELRFLRSRHYPIAGIELGEEPDGQRITPEDYAALYLQFATALHAVDPRARLGGPSWQNLLNDPVTIWPDRASPGHRDGWIGRFLDYLDRRQRIRDFRFFSFEWYPFDNVCDDAATNLAAAPGMLVRDLALLHDAGLPDSIPRYMTEYGYSAHVSTAEVTLPSALFDADLVANFFAHGGSRSYYYGYEPGYLAHEPGCAHWGNLVMFLADSLGSVRQPLPRYYAARLLTHAWADSSGGPHTMFAVQRSETTDSLLSVYAIRRPDHRWSLLLVNRDPTGARVIEPRIAVHGSGATRALRGPVDIWQYSGEQYEFREAGENGGPVKNLPPMHDVRPTGGGVTLPPYSVTVVTGN
jgi:F5/8 type C domain-containing protein